MPEDKSLFHYGRLYHRLLDPPLAEARQVAVDLVGEGSSVVDIGCGTGLLCSALHTEKHCRVVGLDLSLRMVHFAQERNRFDDVTFLHLDAADLSGLGDRSFQHATMLFLMHELPRETQVRVLREALRVAERVIMIDSIAPLPKNAGGLGIRVVEATFGRDHHGHFRSFLAGGGLTGILHVSGLAVATVHRSTFWRNCREVVVVSGKTVIDAQ